jgi:hypothetical protein
MKTGAAIPALLFLGVLVLAAPASATQFTLGNFQVDAAGGTATADLMMDAAPAAGFSGYIINLTVADPSVAEVSGVTYNPALSGLTDTTSRPFGTGHIGWVDVNEVLQAPGGETGVLLATVTVTGKAAGSTTLKATMTTVTDDKGNNMIPSSSLNSPSVTVGGGTVVTPAPIAGLAVRPADLNGDGLYEDIDGDGRITSADVTLFFYNWHWIEENEPTALFDYDRNGKIDFGDIVRLNQMRQ